MAKVTGPLGSFSASGKIGKTLVFFGHLGRNVVRSLVTPANPQTMLQGGNRLMLGALGRAAKPVSRLSLWFADVNQTVPTGQTWVSAFVRNAIDIFGSGATGVTALKAALAGHTATDDWEDEAEGVGLASVVIPYAGTDDTLTGGAQLYALARHTMSLAGSNPELFDRAPYTTELADWDVDDIGDFVADFQPTP